MNNKEKAEMDIFNDIKDIIIDLLVPHIKHVARLGGGWNADSNASAFYWSCSNDASGTNSRMRIGASLCDNGDIEIWTHNKENVNLRIYYNTAISNEPIVYHNPDSKHEDCSEAVIKILCMEIKEYLEKNKEFVMLSNEENSENRWGRYIKEQVVRTFDQSKFDIGKCYEVREIKQTNTELVFPCQCILQNVYDTQLVFLYLKEDEVSNVFSINIQDIDNYEILKMFTTH